MALSEITKVPNGVKICDGFDSEPLLATHPFRNGKRKSEPQSASRAGAEARSGSQN